MRRHFCSFLASLSLLLNVSGCATTPVPYVGEGPRPQISRGRPIAAVDGLGNFFGLISKLILFNWKVDNHAVSEQTENYLVRYMDSPESRLEQTHFSLNEYNPGMAFSRLVHNRKVAWPYRALLGFPTTLLDTLLPGRLFAGLLNGDNYNPFTDTVSIYSDLPVVALHEAGHAHDFNGRKHRGTYALLRIIPFFDLYQEGRATGEAIRFLKAQEENKQEDSAYKVLYPAYGTYVGSYIPFPGGTVAGAMVGHAVGRIKAENKARHNRKREQEMEKATEQAQGLNPAVQPATQTAPPAATPSPASSAPGPASP